MKKAKQMEMFKNIYLQAKRKAEREVSSELTQEAVSSASDNIVPKVYATLALALYNDKVLARMGDAKRHEAIMRIFAESQRIWTECVDKGMDINEIDAMCMRETGVSIVNASEL